MDIFYMNAHRNKPVQRLKQFTKKETKVGMVISGMSDFPPVDVTFKQQLLP